MSKPRLLALRNYKTVMCEFFQRGSCRSGSQCTYAHGSQELRAANSFLKMQGLVSWDEGGALICPFVIHFLVVHLRVHVEEGAVDFTVSSMDRGWLSSIWSLKVQLENIA